MTIMQNPYLGAIYSVTLGKVATASTYGVAVGNNAAAAGDNGIAIGKNANVNVLHADAVAIGVGATTTKTGQIMLGTASTAEVKIPGTVQCTGAGTGALQVDGGIYAAKRIWADGEVRASGGIASIYGDTLSYLYVQENNNAIILRVGINGSVNPFFGAPPSSVFLGSGNGNFPIYLTVNGQAIVALTSTQITQNKPVVVTDITDCTAPNTGALQVAGGAYVAKQLRVDGTVTVDDNINVTTGNGYKVNNVQVVGAQQGAITNAPTPTGTATSGGYGFATQNEMTTFLSNVGTVASTVNSILSALRTHGLINT
jgi:hypothetical protein